MIEYWIMPYPPPCPNPIKVTKKSGPPRGLHTGRGYAHTEGKKEGTINHGSKKGGSPTGWGLKEGGVLKEARIRKKRVLRDFAGLCAG